MQLDGPRSALSRRRFIAVSATAGSALALAGCSDEAPGPVAVGPNESDAADVEILNAALDLEWRAVAAYKAAAGLLSGAALRSAKLLLEHEQEHVDGLAAAIRDLGGTPNRAQRSYELPRLRTQPQALRFAIALEQDAIAAYIDALPKLSDPDLRATAASIATAEAEHVALLRIALGQSPLREAFVAGRAA